MREARAAAPRVELRIDALAAGGDGVGRAPDGRVVFAPFTAPGDRVRVRLTEQRPRFARGEIEALLEPGPDRVAPRCPVFGSCGGCAWQHVRYEAQVDAKRAILRDALVRIGGVDPARLPPIAFTPSPAPYGHRGRARVLVSGGRVGYRRRRSHALQPVAACPVLAPPLERALAALAERPPAGEGEWELALGADGAVRVAPLGPGAAAAPRLALRAGAERLEVSAGVFAQGNALLLDPLAEAVLEAAGGGGEVLELYAGAGFFTLGLARRFARTTAVEADAAAARDLARNLAAAGLDRVARAVQSRVEDWLESAEARRARPDAIVLDPPRGGVGRAAAGAIAALPARRIVHLSCDPATLARDLPAFAACGFRLAAVRGFDLFPQTPHVEALAVLERSEMTAPGGAG